MGRIWMLPGLGDRLLSVSFVYIILFSVSIVVRSSVNGRHKGLRPWVDQVHRRQDGEACPQCEVK